MPDSPPTSSSSSNDDLTRSGERYSEQEMALILKRAAELQEGADGRGAQRTMREIQELAALGGVAIAINITDNALFASGIVAASAISGTVVSARALWFGIAERWKRRTRSIVGALAERAEQLRTKNDEGVDLGARS